VAAGRFMIDESCTCAENAVKPQLYRQLVCRRRLALARRRYGATECLYAWSCRVGKAGNHQRDADDLPVQMQLRGNSPRTTHAGHGRLRRLPGSPGLQRNG